MTSIITDSKQETTGVADAKLDIYFVNVEVGKRFSNVLHSKGRILEIAEVDEDGCFRGQIKL